MLSEQDIFLNNKKVWFAAALFRMHKVVDGVQIENQEHQENQPVHIRPNLSGDQIF